MPSLEHLHPDHARAVLTFERDNRTYFATSISDRGDDFFDQFGARYQKVLDEQAAGISAFYVLVEDDGEVLGRFNLYGIDDGAAEIGYRVAQQVAGHGVATTALRELCGIAVDLGLRVLIAATSYENVASQKVLAKAGFVSDGSASPSQLGGKKGIRYRLDLRAIDRPPAEQHDAAIDVGRSPCGTRHRLSRIEHLGPRSAPALRKPTR